jgi:nucleoid-associated protein YgaU
MLKKNLILTVLVVFAAGCGIEAKTYVMTKSRVGLDQTGGNAGCLMGQCPPASPPLKTTRKVYVLELTRPVPESEVKKIEENAVNAITEGAPSSGTANAAPASNPPAPTATDNTSNTPPASSPQPTVPVMGELPGANPAPQAAAPSQSNGGSVQAATYTVQKDDTLQKISKKIYGSYGKWYKIYEANKDKIKNPNILKPGMVLTIPSLGQKAN